MMRAAARGFSLLEAIVALTILAMAMLGAYAWIGANLEALNKVRDLALEELALREALDVLERTDLGAQPEGELSWGEFRIGWRAEPLEPMRNGRTAVGSMSLYDFTLFQVDLEVHSHQRLIATPQVRVLRHERVRDPQFVR
jgi:general secretion pathway protein I